MKKTTIKKPEAIKWHHFSRRGDAIFLSLKKEIRISVLSVATLAVACPDSSAAIMAMSQRPTMDEQTNSAGASSSGGEDELLDLTALQHGDLLFCVASPARDGIAQAIVSVTEGIDLQRVSHVAIVCKESSGTYALEASDKHGVWLHPIQSFFEHCDHTPTGNPMEVYVALLPEADATKYSFRLESGENTYTGTATARLVAGEYVVATGLQLTKVNS